jgi:hypothetical protein
VLAFNPLTLIVISAASFSAKSRYRSASVNDPEFVGELTLSRDRICTPDIATVVVPDVVLGSVVNESEIADTPSPFSTFTPWNPLCVGLNVPGVTESELKSTPRTCAPNADDPAATTDKAKTAANILIRFLPVRRNADIQPIMTPIRRLARTKSEIPIFRFQKPHLYPPPPHFPFPRALRTSHWNQLHQSSN